METQTSKLTKDRLEYLRGEIEAERISYEEISELQALAQDIEPGDVLLLQWAGVPACIRDFAITLAWRRAIWPRQAAGSGTHKSA